mmetsp:Transcript_4116/g.7230  ORF Transcript_4116/g.7230 Transcript_4116/m.7230 type:complete len:498 (-) Transcript_4116:126-1619(-)
MKTSAAFCGPVLLIADRLRSEHLVICRANRTPSTRSLKSRRTSDSSHSVSTTKKALKQKKPSSKYVQHLNDQISNARKNDGYPQLGRSADSVRLDSLNLQPEVRSISWGTLSTRKHRNVVSYNLQLKQLCKNRELRVMLSLLKEMRRSGIQPDVFSYSSVLHCCRKNQAIDIATRVFRRMKRDGVEPDARTYSRMIAMYGQAKPPRAAEAHSVFQEMLLKFKPSSNTCNILLDACARGREVLRALSVYGKMKEINVQVDENTYLAMAKVYYNVRMFNEAIEMFRLMARSGIQSGAVSYTQLMHGLCKQGKFDLCLKTLDTMRETGVAPGRGTYHVLIAACGQIGDSGRAFEFFQEMETLGVGYDHHSYNALLFAFYCCNKMDEALQLYSSMISTTLEPNNISYRTMLRLAAKCNQASVIERVARDVEMSSSCTPSPATCAEIVAAAVACNDTTLAKRLCTKFRPNSKNTDEFYSIINRVLGRLGHQSSVEVLQELLD